MKRVVPVVVALTAFWIAACAEKPRPPAKPPEPVTTSKGAPAKEVPAESTKAPVEKEAQEVKPEEPAVSPPVPPATVVEITDRVLVKDSVRLGINLGGDNYYSGAVLVKKRARENFEGTSYRQCHFGPVNDEEGATTWFSVSDGWKEILVGGRYTILSGPSKGTTGVIRDVTTRKAEHKGQMKDFSYFVFDKKVKPGPANMGVMVESLRLKEGQFRRLDGYWCSKENEISIGDVHPGAYGVAAAHLKATNGRAHLRFASHYQRYGQTNGTWNVHFWAKAKEGTPSLLVAVDRTEWGESRTLRPPPEWKKYEIKLKADKVPEPKGPKDNPHMLFRFEVTGGGMLLDDVEIWMDGDTNPTAFRDDLVAMLKKYNPGMIRFLQMGGNTLENCLRPPIAAHSFTSMRSQRPGPYERHNRTPYSLHQLYELCELLGSEPWYCLPGTLSTEEMVKFMEYIGAPSDTGYGRLRAELGHPEPWTETFGHIHVEYGNEAWNNSGPYQVGGFNGGDYWQDLIAAGKSSPYYTETVIFHAAGQASNSWRNRSILKNVPNADCFSVAPYILSRLDKREMDVLKTDEELFAYVFGVPIWRAMESDGAMHRNFDLARKAGEGGRPIELSIYEINHHTTHGDAPLEPRNRVVTSIGGGLNVANTMLLELKVHNVRNQCLFSLVQHSYKAHNIGPVRLWGTALNMRGGRERYRPTFLACSLANRVIGGDLVETVLSGAVGKVSALGLWKNRQKEFSTYEYPAVFSYAFREGRRRGLILVNLHTSEPQPVEIRFSGKVQPPGALSWLLTSENITDSNEFEEPEPKVSIREEKIAPFASGARIELPPFSMRGLVWEVE